MTKGQSAQVKSTSVKLLTLEALNASFHPEIVEKLLIKNSWETSYKIAFLQERENTIPQAVLDMLKLRTENPQEYEKLVESIRLQLQNKGPLKNRNRVKQGKPQRAIYEFRSSGKGYRLFFFFYNDAMIICTHAWQKQISKNNKLQNQQFKKADKLRLLFESSKSKCEENHELQH